MSTEQHNPRNLEGENFDIGGTESVRMQVCNWLRANEIDPGRVAADARASLVDGHLTLVMKVRHPDGGDMIAPEGDDVLKETKTFPISVPPPPLVETWLAPKCPACGR
jgi:hypothetical protein